MADEGREDGREGKLEGDRGGRPLRMWRDVEERSGPGEG